MRRQIPALKTVCPASSGLPGIIGDEIISAPETVWCLPLLPCTHIDHITLNFYLRHGRQNRQTMPQHAQPLSVRQDSLMFLGIVEEKECACTRLKLRPGSQGKFKRYDAASRNIVDRQPAQRVSKCCTLGIMPD